MTFDLKLYLVICDTHHLFSKQKTLKRILMCTFLCFAQLVSFHVYAKRNLKILKSPEMDFDVYIFTFRVIFFVSSIRQTQFEKCQSSWNGFWCRHFYVLRNFFHFTYTPNANLKITKIPKNGFWCVHFYVMRKFFRFTYTSNANLKKYQNSLEWILMCTFLRYA